MKIPNGRCTLTQWVECVVGIDLFVCLYVELILCYTSAARVIGIIPDMLNVLLLFAFVAEILNGGKLRSQKNNTTAYLIGIFLLLCTISFAWNQGSLVDGLKRYRYILWSVLTFYCCRNYLTEKFYKKIFRFFYYSLWIHSILVFYQGMIMKPGVDRTNGIWGFVEYNNAAQGVFCLFMAFWGIASFLNKSLEKRKSISLIILPCIDCALAEIKAFYVLFIIGAVIIIIYNCKDMKKIKKSFQLIFIGIAGVAVAFVILMNIMPENLYAFKNLARYAAYESYETTRADGLGRLTQIQWIYSHIFTSDFISSLFGKGVGYSLAGLAYELGCTFATVGFIGLGLLIMLFIINFLRMWAARTTRTTENAVCAAFSLIEILTLIIWNSTLNRMGYLVFFVLALGTSRALQTKEKTMKNKVNNTGYR